MRPHPLRIVGSSSNVAPSASPEEAAAVVAALERFILDTAPPRAAAPKGPGGWERAARHEATGQVPRRPWGAPRA